MKVIYLYTEMLIERLNLQEDIVIAMRYNAACTLANKLFKPDLAAKVCKHTAWHVWFSQVWNCDDAALFFEIEDSGFLARDITEAYTLYLHHHQLLFSNPIFPPDVVMRLIDRQI